MSAAIAITPDHRDGEGGDEDVVVLDVAELVGQHALELHAVELLEQAGGDGDGGVLRVAAGGEGVRGRVVDDVEARLGQPAGDAEALDEVVQPAVLLDRRRARPAHRAARWSRTSSRRRPPTPPASSSAKTMKYGPAADEQVERGAHRQHEADEDEDQDVGAALVLGDLVVHAGVRVLGGSETSVRRWGERAGCRRSGGRRGAGGVAAEVDRRGVAEVDLDVAAGRLVHLEVLALVEVELVGDDVRGDRLDLGVIAVDGVVVELPRVGDAALGAGELLLQVEEVLVRLEVGVGLRTGRTRS